MNNFMVIKSRPWYDKNFVNLEAALEILSTANGFRSAWIFMERKKEFPNQKKIDQWKKEQIDFLNKIQEIRSLQIHHFRYQSTVCMTNQDLTPLLY